MTVGIVLVSHSARLADAAAELARGMASADLRLALAGGVDDPDQPLGDKPLGTDAMRVLTAIQQVDGPDGVLVLMDLGSALLSAEMAVDMLPPDQQARVALCDAPFVEGAVAAAVQAAAGSDLQRVAEEARRGLTSKSSHLGSPVDTTAAPTFQAPIPPADAPAASGTIAVTNAHGLHARPAARIVGIVTAHEAEVTLQRVASHDGPVRADSLNAIIMLGVRQGDDVLVSARGAGADAVLAELSLLAAEGFGDDVRTSPAAPPAPRMTPRDGVEGYPAAPGVGVGPACPLQPLLARPAAAEAVADPGVERQRLETALRETADHLRATARTLKARTGPAAGAILEAQVLLLTDPLLTGPAGTAITQDGCDALTAWQSSVAAVVEAYRSLDDDYLAGRAADVAAIGTEVAGRLLGETTAPLDLAGVVIASDLSPAQATVLDAARVDAIVTAGGSPTSHTALVAAALGIPAVVGAGPAVLDISAGTTVVVDGDSGRVVSEPDEQTLAHALLAERERAGQRRAVREQASSPAATRDGTTISVMANVGLPGDAGRAAAEGADGVGLLRSEFLFLDRSAAPDEQEQFDAYGGVCDAVAGPVTLRLLDVGGDKPLRYVELPAEANPFLGVRGVRVALSQPQLLLPQLRAALRVAAERPLRLLIPMVSRVAEVTQVRRLVDEARDGLLAEGKAVPGRIDLGVMVEVPAAALLADALVEHADFLSIGTNDLTQYVMAADRGNVGVAHLNDALEPAVLRLIASVCKAARDAEVSAGVCGAIASDTMAIPLLLALGVQELSVPPPAVAMVKQAVRNTNLAEAVTVAERALACESAAAVRDLIQELPPARPDTDGAVGQTSASTASSGRGTRSRSTDWTSRRA